MTTTTKTSPRVRARIAGFFYFLIFPLGAIQMVLGRVGVSTDVAVTAANILAHPAAIHTAVAVDLLVVACYLPVTALLYLLFKPVSHSISMAAAFFDLIGCAVQSFATVFRVAPLVLLSAMPSSSAIRWEQMELLAYLLLKLYTPAYRIALVFFGFHLILIGTLVFRSTFMPRLLGVLVVIAGCGWLTFLWPPLAELLWPRFILTLGIGEGALILWLLIAGVNVDRWNARAAVGL